MHQLQVVQRLLTWQLAEESHLSNSSLLDFACCSWLQQQAASKAGDKMNPIKAQASDLISGRL